MLQCLFFYQSKLKLLKNNKKSKSEFHTKIREALFIKKRNLSLNRQHYANGSLFLLSVF